MHSSQQHIQKIANDVGSAVSTLLTQGARALVEGAEERGQTLPPAEVARRLQGALRVIEGKAAATDVKRTPLEIAEAMVRDYTFEPTSGMCSFEIPAGVTDREAREAVNQYFREHQPECKRDAIFEKDFKNPGSYFWMLDVRSNRLPDRDASQGRAVTVTAVVENTNQKTRDEQGARLGALGLEFANTSDLALAAALHACKFGGEDLFGGARVRGHDAGYALLTHPRSGVVVVDWHRDDVGAAEVVASGAPSSRA